MTQHSITAVFDTRVHADEAITQLEASGIPVADIAVLPADGEAIAYTETTKGKGFWASLEELFGGTEDHAAYAESLRRGGIMVTVRAEESEVDRVVDILEQHGSIDLAERETTWRSEGWTAHSTATGAMTTSTAGQHGVGFETTGLATAGGIVAAERLDKTSDAERRETPVAGVVGAVHQAADDVLQVVEERLDVGKRAVNRGKVRIRSSVVTRDVSEDVTLHRETVSVDRRTVDQPLSASALSADPFKERVVEVDEYDEQAVVAKSAHVIEEIGIRKDAADRIETVTDTLRSTRVDIEDGRTLGVAGVTGALIDGVRDDMEVVGSDGAHVGTVDHLDGGKIKLKKVDPASGGQHQYLRPELVKSVADKVTLAVTAAEAKTVWSDAA